MRLPFDTLVSRNAISRPDTLMRVLCCARISSVALVGYEADHYAHNYLHTNTLDPSLPRFYRLSNIRCEPPRVFRRQF